MEQNQAKTYVKKINTQGSEFCIIGLTGKIHAGTSDVCKLLTSKNFGDYVTQPANTTGFPLSEIREHKIMFRYLHHNWHPFVEVSVTNVILSFFLEIDSDKYSNKPELSGLSKIIDNTLRDNQFITNAIAHANSVAQTICRKDESIVDDSWLSGTPIRFIKDLHMAWSNIQKKNK